MYRITHATNPTESITIAMEPDGHLGDRSAWVCAACGDSDVRPGNCLFFESCGGAFIDQAGASKHAATVRWMGGGA
jgi:hypothetical protein